VLLAINLESAESYPRRLPFTLLHGCCTTVLLASSALIFVYKFSCKTAILRVEPKELEPLTSAVQRRIPNIVVVR
jgi:hypothetical protein